MFNEDSFVVDVWARKVKEGAVTLDEVPALFNLRDVVRDIINRKDDENV